MSWSHKAAGLACGESLPEKPRAVMEMKVVVLTWVADGVLPGDQEKTKVYDRRFNTAAILLPLACGIGRETAREVARYECDDRGWLGNVGRNSPKQISALGRAVETVVGGITNPCKRRWRFAVCPPPAVRRSTGSKRLCRRWRTCLGSPTSIVSGRVDNRPQPGDDEIAADVGRGRKEFCTCCAIRAAWRWRWPCPPITHALRLCADARRR